MTIRVIIFLAWGLVLSADAGKPLQLQLRDRVESKEVSGQHRIRLRKEAWKPEETAVIVCDMWDAHHCLNAVRRAKELVPRMNALLKNIRARGGLVIHAPSSCMAAYADHPARKRAQAVPRSKTAPKGISEWLHWIDEREKEAGYPIDHSDGGEDDDPQEHAAWAAELQKRGRNPRSPWKSQIASLEIDPKRDLITDSGIENWSILEKHGIRNVLMVGVHTNMCVLGRPFGLRQLKRNGVNVVLVRDLTDTMYNPAMPPKVSHFSGTDLVIGHIEKYVCPTVGSSDILGGHDFVFSKDERKKIVFLIGEREYKTAETLPAFAEARLTSGYRCQFLFAETGSNDFGDVASALKDADALFVSVRRRTPEIAQMKAIENFIKAGKPVIGIRTASHAFSLRGKKAPPGYGSWEKFDPEIFGGNYHGHHGSKLKTFAKVVGNHPIIDGMARGEFPTGGSLYKVSPLQKGATILLEGRAASIKQPEPVAWTFTNIHGGRSFYTSLGHVNDFANPVFVTFLKRGIDWALKNKLDKITTIEGLSVPGVWEKEEQWKNLDGEAWYAATVRLPKEWIDGVALEVESLDNAAELFVNGEKIGALGSFPPQYRNGLDERAKLKIPGPLLKSGQKIEIAVRIYDHGGRGGFKGRAPLLTHGNDAIVMAGQWAFRPGAGGPPTTTGLKPFEAITRTSRSAHETDDGPLSPEDSLSKFKIPDDLDVDLVLHEPLISQPLHLSFDERGRLWVVQYRQYPNPAGLKAMSRDLVWRVAYDRMPPPPPHAIDSPFRGKDRITIHEDTDGDGRFDSHKVFMDGLNMATSIAHDVDGIWVTNPPYLLFVPDRNEDDVADEEIEVHLRGFGLEDSHSIANSLCWGPDGWLYGAQGSTVSAAITRPEQDLERDAIQSMGQNIWRYHPKHRVYEIFAEGGGNAFGVEIDRKGRVFSGHNGGDTRGFHYLPGAYYRKGWNKHGALTNPHAYGFFPAMKNAPVARFTHQFVVYEDVGLPERYRNKLWGVDVLHNNIVLSKIFPDGSTFQTRDIERVVSSTDPWFRPVMMTPAPDGSLYLADWYDRQVNHYRNHEGRLDPDHGRIYRIRQKDRKVIMSPDFAKLEPQELITKLDSPSRWQRQTALRLLRETAAKIPAMNGNSLDHFWGAAAIGRADFSVALESADADVRRWAVRLACDGNSSTRPPLERLLKLAATESNAEVVAQIACSAKRIGGVEGLRLAAQLARRDQFASDPHIPMLIWWAFEATAPDQEAELDRILSDPVFWEKEMVRNLVAKNLIRRFASEGTHPALVRCGRLFQLAPDLKARRRLISGLNAAFSDHPPVDLPTLLAGELAHLATELPISLQLRIHAVGARERAFAALDDETLKESKRLELLAILASIDNEEVRTTLVNHLENGASTQVEVALLAALVGKTPDERLRNLAFERLDSSHSELRNAALEFLASDRESARALMKRLTDGKIEFPDATRMLAEKLRAHQDPEINRLVGAFWDKSSLKNDFEAEIARVDRIVGSGGGIPKKGEAHFKARCASCHRMFDQGGLVGPDLTSYQRSDHEALLLAIIAPSAEVREGYQHTVVRMKTGEVHSGFREEFDEQRIVLRQTSGQPRVIRRTEIAHLEVSDSSLMPAGLLGGMSDENLRDLFAYLRSTTPPF